MKRITTYLLFLLVAISVKAQDAAADFAKVDEIVSNAQSVSMDLTYKFYPTRSSNVPDDIRRGVYYKEGNKFFSQLLDIELLQNDSILVAVDKINKVALISAPQGLPKTPSVVDLKNTLKSCSSINKNIEGANIKYTLGFTGQNYECDKLDVYIDKNTHFLSKIVFYFRPDLVNKFNKDAKEPPREKMEIAFSSVKLSANIDNAVFSETKYLKVVNGTYQCNNQYKGYRLIDKKSKHYAK